MRPSPRLPSVDLSLTELLPRSGYAATSANVGLAGSILFALF
jgi:hypothetical protein